MMMVMMIMTIMMMTTIKEHLEGRTTTHVLMVQSIKSSSAFVVAFFCDL